MNRRTLTKYLLTLPFVKFLQLSANDNRVIEIYPGQFFRIPDHWDIVYSKVISCTNDSGTFDAFKIKCSDHFNFYAKAIKYKTLKDFKESFEESDSRDKIKYPLRRIYVDGYNVSIITGIERIKKFLEKIGE